MLGDVVVFGNNTSSWEEVVAAGRDAPKLGFPKNASSSSSLLKAEENGLFFVVVVVVVEGNVVALSSKAGNAPESNADDDNAAAAFSSLLCEEDFGIAVPVDEEERITLASPSSVHKRRCDRLRADDDEDGSVPTGRRDPRTGRRGVEFFLLGETFVSCRESSVV